MTDVLIVFTLLLVAATATIVVHTDIPASQAVVLSGYGLLLALLFLLFQAPDVALSQVAVGTAVVPLMVLLTIRAIGRHRGKQE